MPYVDLVAIIAVAQLFFFAYQTGAARRESGLKAPATTGHEGFERMYRVQMNSIETIILFLPALLIAAKYWSAALVALIGIVYVVGRFLYWRAYIADPNTRTIGFLLTIAPTAVLLFMALVGAVLAVFGFK